MRLILLIIGLILLIIPASATVLTVGQDANNDYVTDGTDDGVQINQAITAANIGDTIQLNGTAFEIVDASDSNNIQADKAVIIEGLGDSTIIKISNGGDPLKYGSMVDVTANDVYLRNFTLDADRLTRANQSPASSDESDWGIKIAADDCYIDNVDVYRTWGDNIHTGTLVDNITIINSYHSDSAHACIFFKGGVNQFLVENCTLMINSNAGVRTNGDTSNGTIKDNYIQSYVGGGDFGIEINNANSKIRDMLIENNIIIDCPTAGIMMRTTTSSTTKVANNTFRNNFIAWNQYTSADLSGIWPDGAQAAISLLNMNGSVIEYNTIYNCKYDGISLARLFSQSWQAQGQSYIVRNNIFDTIGGTAINKSLAPATVTITSSYNCFNNTGNNYNGSVVNGSGNIYVNPKFHYVLPRSWGAGNYSTATGVSTDVNMWQLNSTKGRYNFTSASWEIDSIDSPCIDAADINDSVGDEPTPHGDRANMGAYGTTEYASKSSSSLIFSGSDSWAGTSGTMWEHGDTNLRYPPSVVTGLVGWWEPGTDVGSGNTLTDISGNGNDGTIHGATWNVSENALDYNGSSDYVTFGNSASLNPDNKTKIFNIYPIDITGDRNFYGMTPSGNTDSYQRFITRDAKLHFIWRSGGSNYRNYGTDNDIVSVKNWYDLAVTQTNNEIPKIYNSGSDLSISLTASAGVADLPSDTYHSIGQFGLSGGDYFYGSIGRSAIYNITLTNDQINETNAGYYPLTSYHQSDTDNDAGAGYVWKYYYINGTNISANTTIHFQIKQNNTATWETVNTDVEMNINNTIPTGKEYQNATFKWIGNTTYQPETNIFEEVKILASSSGLADTKFEYYNGTGWQEGESYYYLWFTCFWYTAECANDEQSDSQPSLRTTNNGTASGSHTKMKLNESAPAGIKIYVDDNNTFAGAVELSNIYQVVGGALAPGENDTFWTWAYMNGAPTWEFETYAIVE